jgi:hypothetical protein
LVEASVDCAADQYLQEAIQGPSPVTGFVEGCEDAVFCWLEVGLLPGLAWNVNPARRIAPNVVAPSPLFICVDLSLGRTLRRISATGPNALQN